MKLDGKKISIRDLNINDLEAFYEIESNPRVAKLAGFRPVTDEETARFKLQGLIFRQETFAITHNNELIGTINLYHEAVRKLPNVYTIGISLREDSWSLGYGTEACKLMIYYAFQILNASYLEIKHEISNVRSKRMIEKLGFKLEAKIVDYGLDYEHKPYSILLYSLSKQKFMEDIYYGKNVRQ